MTFDVLQEHIIEAARHGWQQIAEAFCRCRNCNGTIIFQVAQREELSPLLQTQFALMKLSSAQVALNQFVRVEGYVSPKDFAAIPPPDFCPADIAAAFLEGAKCLAVNCPNAAGAMFRLSLDLATKPMLPPEGSESGPNSRQRRDLGLRIPWLIEKGLLPEALRELSTCIREDGNDGAHAGTLKKEDAEDMLDFATALLERVYTEPERLRRAKARRDQRRKPTTPAVAAPSKKLPQQPLRAK